MHARYVTFFDNRNIKPNVGDSAGWKVICNSREDVLKCMELGSGQRLQWRGEGDTANLGNIWNTIRRKAPREHLAARTWDTRTPN